VASQVVVGGPSPKVLVDPVAQTVEESLEFGRREEVAKHQHVGLLGRLAVRE
jgi:hypothetical protein